MLLYTFAHKQSFKMQSILKLLSTHADAFKTIRADTIKFHYSPLGLNSLNSSALLANSVKKLCHVNNDSNSCWFWIGLGNLYPMTQYGAVQQTCSGIRTCCKAVSALTKYKSSFKWTIFPYKASWIQWSTSINVRFI